MRHGDRAGRASARTWHRGARRHARRWAEPVQPRHRVPRYAAEARHAAVGAHSPARDDVLPLFHRPAWRAAQPTCTSTCSARRRGARSACRSPISAPTLLKPMSRGRDVAEIRPMRPEPLVEFNFRRPRPRPASASCRAFRMSVEVLAHEKVRAMISHHVPGEIRRPAARCSTGLTPRTRSRARWSPS